MGRLFSVAVDPIHVARELRVPAALGRGSAGIQVARPAAPHGQTLTCDAVAVLPLVALAAGPAAHLRSRRLVEDVRLVDIAGQTAPALERTGGRTEICAVDGGQDLVGRLLSGQCGGAGADGGLLRAAGASHDGEGEDGGDELELEHQ